MGSLVIRNGTVVLPDRLLDNGTVVVRDGRIAAVGEATLGATPVAIATVIDAEGGYIAPGFVDIHVHGGAGADFMDGTPDAVHTANRVHARHGTTSIFPTTTTGSRRQIAAMLDACQTVRDQWTSRDGARIAGVHFYGPYFAPDKVGCHLAEGQRTPDPAEYQPALARGLVKIATCAAELPGAVEFCRAAKQAGCLVTCGHSNASWGEMAAVFAAGMRHVDHFWCAMSSVATVHERLSFPMQGGMEEFVLSQSEMSTEVIADGCHLASELLQFAYQMKGVKRLCLVSDCSRALEMPEGRYRFGPGEDGQWFVNNGRVGTMPDGKMLASSIRALDHMVRTMHRDTDAGLAHCVRMASLTPAERAGVDRQIGSIEVGKCGDVLILSRDLQVQRVFIGGEAFV